jgi:thioredoxin reductase (NADPH)
MQHVAIVGASNSSVDAALEIWRKGGYVTMIIRGENIGERVKYWVRPDIINRIKEGHIKAYYHSEITEIKENEITFNSPDGKKTIANDFVVALTGYKPNFELLNQVGISLSKDDKKLPYYNPETMESNVEGVYLAGVICGGMETHKWFIENSRIHAKLIAAHIENTL